MTAPTEVDVRAELAATDLPERLAALRFHTDDARDLRAALTTVTDGDLGRVQHFADRLLPRVGRLPAGGGDAVWEGLHDPGDGLVPLLALLATARAVSAYHRGRGIAAEDSWGGLADLGQQVAVHRLVHGRFGLETYGWLAGHVWTGSMFWLGRLQFDLERVDGPDGSGPAWVVGTHVPRTGRLTPDAVDASLAVAPPFFATHFADLPARAVHCRSWMLDRRLPELLPGSNLAGFQRRWRTYGEPVDGDADVAYFAFATRGRVDPRTTVPTTSLQRAALAVWSAGEHWRVVEGRLAA